VSRPDRATERSAALAEVLNPYQVAILRAAFGRMPYGAEAAVSTLTNRYLAANAVTPPTVGDVVTILDALAEALSRAAKRQHAVETELFGMRADLAAVRRVFGVVDQ